MLFELTIKNKKVQTPRENDKLNVNHGKTNNAQFLSSNEICAQKNVN
jgi:hypothetical protein